MRGMATIPLPMLSKPTYTAFGSALARRRPDVGECRMRSSLYLGDWLIGQLWLGFSYMWIMPSVKIYLYLIKTISQQGSRTISSYLAPSVGEQIAISTGHADLSKSRQLELTKNSL